MVSFLPPDTLPPADHFLWRLRRNDAPCSFFALPGLFPRKGPWRLRKSVDASLLVRKRHFLPASNGESSGGSRNCVAAEMPLRAISSPMFVFSLLEGESGVAKAEPALPTRHRRPTISSPLAPAAPGWENIRGERAKAELRSEVSRTLVLFPYGRSTPPEKEPRRRRERGAWSDWFAMIGSFSARLLNSSGKLPKATAPE